MQIEQFDTGLKTKTNVQDIILSPEKNLQNKNLIRGYLNKIITSGVSEIDKNLDEAFIVDVKINSFYPINYPDRIPVSFGEINLSSNLSRYFFR